MGTPRMRIVLCGFCRPLSVMRDTRLLTVTVYLLRFSQLFAQAVNHDEFTLVCLVIPVLPAVTRRKRPNRSAHLVNRSACTVTHAQRSIGQDRRPFLSLLIEEQSLSGQQQTIF